MKNLDHSSNGFVNLTFILILMTFVSLYLTATFSIALSQQRDYVRSTCIEKATENQIENLKKIRKLFSLNPESTKLRAEIKLTQDLIIKAAAQPELIPILEAKLILLKATQLALDMKQKAIIINANYQLQEKHYDLKPIIDSGQKNTASPWRYMISMSSYFTPQLISLIPVRPDSEGGIGPNYEWQENAEIKLKLAYVWNMSFSTQKEYQRFFTWVNVLSLQCSVAPDLRGDKWTLKINADKSLQSMY